MKKFFVVFKFEFSKNVKGKPFIIMTLIAAILIAGVLSFPAIKENFFSPDEVDKPKDDISIVGINTNAVYDENVMLEVFGQAFSDYEVKVIDTNRADAEAAVSDEEYEFIVLIDDVKSYTLITQPTGIQDNSTYKINSILLNFYKTHMLVESGLSAEDATEVLGAQLDANVIETGKNQEQSFFFKYILVKLVYMLIINYCQNIDLLPI